MAFAKASTSSFNQEAAITMTVNATRAPHIPSAATHTSPAGAVREEITINPDLVPNHLAHW
jgi:DNA-binding transcriptional regulator YdaS (Cro superfamily)